MPGMRYEHEFALRACRNAPAEPVLNQLGFASSPGPGPGGERGWLAGNEQWWDLREKGPTINHADEFAELLRASGWARAEALSNRQSKRERQRPNERIR